MRTTGPGRFTVFLVSDNQVTLEALNRLFREVGYETRLVSILPLIWVNRLLNLLVQSILSDNVRLNARSLLFGE
jgi:hypothetical protein